MACTLVAARCFSCTAAAHGPRRVAAGAASVVTGTAAPVVVDDPMVDGVSGDGAEDAAEVRVH